jgi:hypothetical protein
VPLFNLKKRFLQKTVLPPFPPENIYHTVNQVTIYIAGRLCRQLQDVAYAKDLQLGGSYVGVSSWKLWFNPTAVSAGFLVQ